MTGSANGPRVPGTRLLEIAALLFNDNVMATVIEPAIADLQREIADAGPNRLARLRARWRGCRTFWTLALVIPFTRWPARPGDERATFRDVIRRLALGAVALALLTVLGPALGAWVAVLAAAALFALVIHAWYERHPSDVPDPTPGGPWRTPQINFSSTDVAANSGGLIFVLGTILIVAVGLPSVVWFLLGGVAGGCAVAWALVTWRTSHPSAGVPEQRIDGSARRI